MDADAAPTHVIDHVFLGSKAHARDREQLLKLKITHILNVTPSKNVDPSAGVPNFFEKDKLFEYRRCAIFDNKAEDISGALEGCVAFIEQAKFYGRVFVHCSKGVSRSVSMVLAYLIKIHSMTYLDALQLVQAKRSIAQPNPSFEKQLIEYAARMERLRRRKAMEAGKNNTTTVVAGPSARASAKAEAIGPQLPPHLRKRQPDAVEQDASVEQKDGSEGELNEEEEEAHKSSADAMCPALPSHLKRKHEEEERAGAKKKRAGPMIGPARPPSALSDTS